MTTVHGTRGPYAKTPARRAQILEAAFELFAQHGYHGASLSSIADRVGLSRNALLHHFPTKEALLTAVLERRDRLEQERLTALGQQPLGSLLADVLTHNAEAPELIRLNAALAAEAVDAEHPAHDYIHRRYEFARDLTARTLAVLQAGGHITQAVNVPSAAATIIAVMDGLQVPRVHNRGVDMTGTPEQFLRPYPGNDVYAEAAATYAAVPE